MIKLVIRNLIVSAMLALAACGGPPSADQKAESTIGNDTNPSVTDEQKYLNQLRNSAGMISVASNTHLAAAAQNHALYLKTNNVISHDESSVLASFTGKSPSDRATAAGYASKYVGEGIANGSSKADAIDKLMSAIYHRFTLLDLTYDEIGFGYIDPTSDYNGILVHNIGNRQLNAVCRSGNSAIQGKYYPDLCNPALNISATDFDNAMLSVKNQNPTIIAWPSANSTDIPPAFFEETPDPLPDYSVSGYPVSMQFNDAKTGNIVINNFQIYDISAQRYITNTRRIDSSQDPLFHTNEFALFPLERLEWGSDYQVEVEYSENGLIKSLNWRFSTRTLNGNVKKITASDSSISVPNNASSFLYFVPANGLDVISSYQTSFPAGDVIDLKFVDENTIEFKVITAKIGDLISLKLNGKRTITISIR